MGSSGSSNSSRPLTAQEREDIYNSAYGKLNDYIPDKTYTPPAYKTLNDGDYAALEKGLVAPLDRAKYLDMQDSNQAMSDRGIYTSMNAIRNNNDVAERYAPQYAAAGAKVTDLKAGQLSGENAYNLDSSKAADESLWRKADYWQGVYNGTGGTIGSGKAGGWSI